MATADKAKGTGQERKVPNPDKSNTASKGMTEHARGHSAGRADLPKEMDDRRPPGPDLTTQDGG